MANNAAQGREATKGSLSLQNCPPDVFRLVLEQVASPHLQADRDRAMAADLARTAQVCKQFREHTEPYLYQKVYTRIGTSHDTAWLVEALRRRPEIAQWIHALILDEFHPRELRMLLSFAMPHLATLLVQHEGEDIVSVNAPEMEVLNRSVCQQPALKNLVLHFDSPFMPQPLAKEDAFLFHHANLRRIKITAVDFSAFETIPPGYLQRDHPCRIELNESEYTQQAFERLILPFDTRKPLVIQDCHCLPRPEMVLSFFPPGVKGVLPILNLRWIRLDTKDGFGMYLRILEILRNMEIEHHFLATSDFAVEDLRNQEQYQIFAEEKIPPRVSRLVRQRSVLEDAAPEGPELRIQGLDIEVPYRDNELVEAIMRLKERDVSDLEVLFMDCDLHVPDLPDTLFQLAEELGVVLGVLEKKKTPDGSEEGGEEAEDGDEDMNVDPDTGAVSS